MTAELESAIQTAGITLLFAWIVSVVKLVLSPTDSGSTSEPLPQGQVLPTTVGSKFPSLAQGIVFGERHLHFREIRDVLKSLAQEATGPCGPGASTPSV